MTAPSLQDEARPVDSLDRREVAALFDLYASHYDAVTRARFEADLAGKQTVLILRDTQTGQIRGFSTQCVKDYNLGNDHLRILFSGDTLIDPACWGSQQLVRGWCHFAGRVLAESPETPLYWLLISKGYRTYLYLPLFFRDFQPRHDRLPTPQDKLLLEAIALRRFPDAYQKTTGLLRFTESQGQLCPDLAKVPESKQKNPHVRYFLERNPHYAQGDELVCLARIEADNMRSFARAWLLEGM